MKRKVRIEEAKYMSSTILLMIESYNSSNSYPTDIATFDDNLNIIQTKAGMRGLPQTYVDTYICGILGRSGSLQGNAFAQNFNDKIPEYDLSIYPVGEEIELEFDGYILVTDTELIDTKKDVLQIVENASSVDELVDELKDKFNLTEKSDEEPVVIEAGKTPGNLRPKDLAGISLLFSQYLTNPTYIKGNCVEFEITSPYSDFISGGSDTQLMSDIRNYYSEWDSIEVEEVSAGLVRPKEVYPISDQNVYLEVGSDHVRVVPADIEIYDGGTWRKLFGDGTLLPKVVVIDGNNSDNKLPLVTANLRLVDTDNNLVPFTGVRYRSRSTGVVGTDLCFLDTNSDPADYKAIPNLSQSLAMYSREVVNTSSTKFRFYFK